MKADVVLLPRDLRPDHLDDRTVIVFDVLRATTTMIAALHAGVREIRAFGDLEGARQAKAAHPDALLCGERNCLPPEGFDMGNSPGVFGAAHAGRMLLMSTTNGTRAILAAAGAADILIGSLANARAVARYAAELGHDVTLLCSGTDGLVSMEDVLGAGAVLDHLGEVQLGSDLAWLSVRAFAGARDDLAGALMDSQGGRNIINAGLREDVVFCARLDVFDMVACTLGESPVIVKV